MDLYVKAIMFTDRGQEELDKREDVLQTWLSQNQARLKEKFSLGTDSYLPVSPGQQLQMSDDVVINYPQMATALIGKALAIRLELYAVLDLIDSERAYYRNQSFFVVIDGSGAFHFDSIELVLDKLVTQRCPIVFGKRPGKDWLMGNENRVRVERFENFLLEEKYRPYIQKNFGDSLPDAQAGCWGLECSIIKSLSLTARGYELEFDVIDSALEAGIPIEFTDELKEGQSAISRPSSFRGYNTSIIKLDFI